MKTLFLSLFFLSQLSFAAPQDNRICTGSSKTHTLTLRETADGTEVSFEENSPESWGTISKYKVSGKLTNKLVIEKITLQDTLKNHVLTEVLVSILRSRPEFDGEADMSYAIANEYISKLTCQ